MILLSLNLRGVGGTLKSASFRHVLDTTHQNIVFLQETLVHEQKARSFMNKFRPSWVSCVVSSVGTSGGLLVLWDPYLFNPVPYLTCGGILLTGSIFATKREINILNVYGPCMERKSFWNFLANNGLFSMKNLVVVGDLNLTVSTGRGMGWVNKLGSSSGFL
jgi:hypothetical protein